ncbi:MAG: M20/M25/M40 family metallo-hydrolase, partial [Woeseiaceae bacterium]
VMSMRFLLLVTLGLTSMFSSACAKENDHAQRARAAFDLLAEAIQFETVAGRSQVCPYARTLKAHFVAAGFAESDAQIFELEEDDTCSLVVRYPGDDGERRPVIFLAHMDVVDALPEDWSYPPFEMTREGDRLYGRGVMDNKGSVAAITSTLLSLKTTDYRSTRDLYFVVTGDEETTAKTTRLLFSQVPALSTAKYALNADAGLGVLNAERKPVYFQLQTAEKTYATFELTTRNAGGHSSLPRHDNAIYELSQALVQLQGFRFPVRSTESTIAYFRETSKLFPGPVGQHMAAFAADPSDKVAIDFLDQMPGEAAMIRTTCVATTLQGGHAENALPQTASSMVNCRIFPGVSLETVEALIIEAIGDVDVSIRAMFRPSENPPSVIDPAIIEAVSFALERDYAGIPVIPYVAPYSTDGAIFRANGVPTYGVSGQFIVYPEEKRAHGKDEFLPVDSFVKSLHYWEALIRAVSSESP